MSAPSETRAPLPDVNVFVTTTNEAGQAIFHQSSGVVEAVPLADGKVRSNPVYTTNEFPPSLNNDKDIHQHESFKQTQKAGVISAGGTSFAVVDCAPGFESPSHRTESLDFAAIIEGEIELLLDSGEKRILKRGDTVVQRATMHAWRNTSQTEWARMIIVGQECISQDSQA